MSLIHIIGIGYKPLSREEEEVLKRVSLIFCFNKTEEVFQKYPLYFQLRHKLRITKSVKELVDFLKEILEVEVGILATGDPLVCGLGETLLKEFPKERICIYPDLSTVNVFCAKLKISPRFVKVYTLHGRNLSSESLIFEIKRHPFLFIFTDSLHNPAFIAQLLESNDLTYLKLYIGERLGSLEEKIYSGAPRDFIEATFKEPNCLLIENHRWG
ncbi:MAG: precorrin-6y C5,15-methyltransferase (decarboxylating) subunit CbiE, partial [Caldimicrobium sp.]